MHAAPRGCEVRGPAARLCRWLLCGSRYALKQQNLKMRQRVEDIERHNKKMAHGMLLLCNKMKVWDDDALLTV